MEEFILGVKFRLYSLIRANKRAGSAARTISFHISYLLNNLNDLSFCLWSRGITFRRHVPLDFHSGLYCFYGADSGAFAAPFAPIVAPADYVREFS